MLMLLLVLVLVLVAMKDPVEKALVFMDRASLLCRMSVSGPLYSMFGYTHCQP